MENVVDNYLLKLNNERCWKKPKEAEIIIYKIHECFKQEKEKFITCQLIDMVLDDNAIFAFIWKACSDVDTIASVSSAFKFLDYLVIDLQPHTEPYFKIIFQKCVFLFDVPFAKVKELALILLKNLISIDKETIYDLSPLLFKLKNYLKNLKKIQGTVVKQCYNILSLVFAKYPDVIKDDANWFFENICDCLGSEITKKRTLTSCVVQGAFNGLDGHLVNFSSSLNNDNTKVLYKFIKNVTEREKKLDYYFALKVFQNHWFFFSKLIYDDKSFWKRTLYSLLKKEARDQKCAYNTLDAFYQVITSMAKQNIDDSDLAKDYILEFSNVLQSKRSNFWEKKSALVGLKYFVLANFFNDKLNEIYNLVLNFVRQKELEARYVYFPSCLECISAFTFKFYSRKEKWSGISYQSNDQSNFEYSFKQTFYLQRLCVLSINQYPEMDQDVQSQLLVALEKTFYILGLCSSKILEIQLNTVIHQGLIRCCSLLTDLEIELLESTTQHKSDIISCKSYLPLWKYLLSITKSSINPIGGSHALKKDVGVKVFDSFINSFIKIITKLNLNSETSDSNVNFEKPEDIRIFINLVDLYDNLMHDLKDESLLFKWISQIFRKSIYMSYKNPYVAGFYKIISVTFKLADKIHYFDGQNVENKNLIGKFLENILTKLHYFKNDLQIACLETLFAAPFSIVKKFWKKIVPLFEVAFYRGRECFNLLKSAYDTLEKWNFLLPSSEIPHLMENVLPHMSFFFRNPQEINSKKDSQVKNFVFHDDEFLALQKKFLIFLGNLKIETMMNLNKMHENFKGERKLTDKSFNYFMPFKNVMIEIKMDDMIFKIIKLSLFCDDRITRIRACESLYSIATIMVGSINQLNGGFTSSFEKIIRTCFLLACDLNSVVYQIFEPFMYQITRYFSGKKAIHFTETEDFIKILINFVSHPYYPMRRDLASSLLREFTEWSIKQFSPGEEKNVLESICKILKHIFSLSLHSCYSKRLGAAFIFNKLYSVLKEEEHLISIYGFQLFYSFMQSLRMCNEEEEDVSEISHALNHMKILILEKSEALSVSCPLRLVPVEFEGGVLEDLVKWTLKRCWDTKSETRKVSMNIVEDLVPKLQSHRSLSKLVNFYYPELNFNINLEYFKNDFQNWLNCFHGAFDFYTWMVNKNIVNPENLIQLNFNLIFSKFNDGLLRKEMSKFECLKFKCVLSYLKLLTALKSITYSFNDEVWKIIKISLYNPSQIGLDLHDNLSCEIFSEALKDFCQLSEYRCIWEKFFIKSENHITLPVLNCITQKQYTDLQCLEFLFTIRILNKSGILRHFNYEMCSFSAKLLINKIFESLFFKKGDSFYIAPLEPSCQDYLEELMQVALDISINFEDLLICINNRSQVIEENTGKVTTKGEHFYLLFKNIIFGPSKSKNLFLKDKITPRPEINEIKFFLEIFCNTVSVTERKNLGKTLIQNWKSFDKLEVQNCSSNYKMMLLIACKIAESISDPGCLKESHFAECIFLKEEVQTDELEALSNLLPYLSDYAETENERLENYLNRVLLKEQNIKLLLKGLIDSLVLSGSLVILRCILRLPSSFFSPYSKELESAFLNLLLIPTDQACRAFELVYKAFFFSDGGNSSVLPFYETFIIPMLKCLPDTKISNLIICHLDDICRLICSPVDDDNVQHFIKSQLEKKKCAANLLQIFVSNSKKENLDNLPEKKKVLFDTLIKKSFHCRKDSSEVMKEKEAYRKFMCEVFNMICAVICARSRDYKIYKLFIFDERISFLHKTIDFNAKFNLEMDFDEIPRRKKIITALRKEVKSELEINFKKTLESIKYIQADTLFSSSLVEDVTKFDFAHSPIRLTKPSKELSSKQVEITLEVDSLNDHECMATIIAVIIKMESDKILPPAKPEEPHQIPCWLNFFISTLKNPVSPNNSKLFALKVLYNVQDCIKPYLNYAFPVILTTLLTVFKESKLNYFLIDLIEIMAKWKTLPENFTLQKELTDLVVLVIEKSEVFQREVLQYNLEFIKLLVETWKKNLLSREFLFIINRLADYSNDSLSFQIHSEVVYVYIQVCGILLANRIPLWTEGYEVRFFDVVSAYFFKENRSHARCAEVCGLALKYLEEILFENINSCEKLVCEKISLHTPNELILVHGIHIHYPKIVNNFIYDIFTSAWNSTDSFALKKLEMLLSYSKYSDEYEDVFDQCGHLFLADKLGSPDAAVQEIALQIVNNTMEKMNEEKCEVILIEIMKLKANCHPNIRKWMYASAKKYLLKNGSNHKLNEYCKVILLKGLMDDVKELEEFCVAFWLTHFEPSSRHKFIVQLFKSLYSPEIESTFLTRLIKILIRSNLACNLSENFIFQQPIAQDLKFEKQIIFSGMSRAATLSLLSKTCEKHESIEQAASLKTCTLEQIKYITVISEPGTNQSEAVSSESNEFINPFKKRFYKNAAKNNFLFKKWRMKKNRNSKKEESTENKGREVNLLGEYTLCNYPNIQIRHSNFFKSLEALATRDHHVAREFLRVFYSGVIMSINPSERKELLTEISKCFETILKSSFGYDTNVIGLILQIVLDNCNEMNIDFELISQVALSSNCLTLGALIIEYVMDAKEGMESSPMKRIKGIESPEERKWLELARLYRFLQESDVVCGILSDKVNVPECAKEALANEALLNWDEASKSYKNAIAIYPDSGVSEFYTESYLWCLAKLSDWSSLNECICNTVDQNVEKVWENHYLLFWFIKSEMMTSLEFNKNDFYQIMNKLCEDKSKFDLLSRNFEEEMAVYDFVIGKHQRANLKIEQMCLNFLKSWSDLSQWCENLRVFKLLKLQTLSELSNLFETNEKGERSCFDENNKIKDQRWMKTTCLPHSDLLVWDTKLSYRRKFLENIQGWKENEAQIMANLSIAKAALTQGNFRILKKYLDQVEEKLDEVGEDLKMEYIYLRNLEKMNLFKIGVREKETGFDYFSQICKDFFEQITKAVNIESAMYLQIHLFRCNFILGETILDVLPFFAEQEKNSDVLKVLESYIGVTRCVRSSLNCTSLREKGLEFLEAAKNIAETLEGCRQQKSDIYLKLANVLINFSDFMNEMNFLKIVIYLLRSMALENEDAKRLFGFVFKVSNSITCQDSLLEDLQAESNVVPTWMFLMWSNQILKGLDSKLFLFLKPIARRLAQEYPSALRYSLKLNESHSHIESPRSNTFLKELGELLPDNNAYDTFLKAVQYLASPKVILNFYLEKFFKSVNQSAWDFNESKSDLSKLYDFMFSPTLEVMRGPVFKFWSDFKQPLETLLTLGADQEAWVINIKKILSEVEKSSLPSGRVLGRLESYSPWLYNFHAFKVSFSLEMPGQYDGEHKPNFRNDVLISSFRSEVIPLNSKCRPLKVIIVGNDAAEHAFLVKFGEDLRQDERIQHVFKHFNYTLKKSHLTENFYVNTYKVIPMSFNLGIIEWVDSSASLYDVLLTPLEDKGEAVAKAQVKHLKFLAQNNEVENLVKAHLHAYENLKRYSAVSSYNELVQLFPQNLLKKSLMHLSTSSEHFMYLRKNFTISHAIMCLTHWLVGIGDRHLQNTLVSTSTGRVIGIDFGYAFGFTTQFLTPPELVPFRLTPQILNAVSPLNESGWIKQTMIKCLLIFRQSIPVLSSVLEVLALEPVSNLIKHAEYNTRSIADSSGNCSNAHKMSMIKKKLSGENPVFVFEEDLKIGHLQSKYLVKYLEVLRGNEQDNVRARMNKSDLTVEEQVECLIDLATDRHVLSKTYIGWNPWL